MSSTKKILSAVISLTAAAAVITAVRYAVSDKNAEYTFSGFYFDTAVTCKTVSSDGSLSESCKSIVSELDKIASAYDENSAVYKIDHGEKFSPEKYPDIGNMLNGYKSFEEKFGEGITPFCGSLTLLWNISSDAPYVPTETEISAALENVNSPKVVVNKNMNALYFSRSVIPFQRNAEKEGWLKGHTYYKHIGLYAYRADVLKEITSLPQSSLELAESLEQLRWLENGYTIKVGISEVETIGIDTPQDLARAEAFLKQREGK